jgi:hypothetical protein
MQQWLLSEYNGTDDLRSMPNVPKPTWLVAFDCSDGIQHFACLREARRSTCCNNLKAFVLLIGLTAQTVYFPPLGY